MKITSGVKIKVEETVPILDGYNDEVKYRGHYFSEGLCVVETLSGKGYINSKGEEVTPCHFSDAREFHCGLAAVQEGVKWGFIDKNGDYKIKPIYDDVSDFNEGYATVEIMNEKDPENNFNAIIDTEGSVVGVSRRSFVHERGIQDGFAICVNRLRHQYRLFKLPNDPIEFDFYTLRPPIISENKIVAQNSHSGLEYYIKLPELTTLKGEYYKAFPFSEGLAGVRSCDKGSGYIDSTGELVIPYRFTIVHPFHNDVAVVRHNFHSRLINKNGKFITGKYKFGWIEGDKANDGLIPALDKKAKKWGYIDTKGKFVIPGQYSKVHKFAGGYAVAQIKEGESPLYVCIDESGNVVTKKVHKYYEVTDLKDIKEGTPFEIVGYFSNITHDGKTTRIEAKDKITHETMLTSLVDSLNREALSAFISRENEINFQMTY